MMPQLLTVKVNRPDRRPIRIWIPVLPVLFVLSPILVLVAVAAGIACRIYGIGVRRALGTGWRVVSALPGAQFELEQGRVDVLVSIR